MRPKGLRREAWASIPTGSALRSWIKRIEVLMISWGGEVWVFQAFRHSWIWMMEEESGARQTLCRAASPRFWFGRMRLKGLRWEAWASIPTGMSQGSSALSESKELKFWRSLYFRYSCVWMMEEESWARRTLYRAACLKFWGGGDVLVF